MILCDTVLLMKHRNELYTLKDIFNANANPFAQHFPKALSRCSFPLLKHSTISYNHQFCFGIARMNTENTIDI